MTCTSRYSSKRNNNHKSCRINSMHLTNKRTEQNVRHYRSSKEWSVHRQIYYLWAYLSLAGQRRQMVSGERRCVWSWGHRTAGDLHQQIHNLNRQDQIWMVKSFFTFLQPKIYDSKGNVHRKHFIHKITHLNPKPFWPHTGRFYICEEKKGCESDKISHINIEHFHI